MVVGVKWGAEARGGAGCKEVSGGRREMGSVTWDWRRRKKVLTFDVSENLISKSPHYVKHVARCADSVYYPPAP